ncbi:MAG: zinc-binding alcohol dehydrogenase [Spirochaetales bacterium]|nr:zinc-binding alcohol dehydrogenase [Spirochaetales bacterium]MCF7938048.1 zinc-binding alcohol dehydrogenase [Spirochaetales bacterium]
MSNTGTARVVFFSGNREIEIREEPVSLKPGQILVQSEAMGISHGTELLAYRGELPAGIETDTGIKALTGKIDYPLRYGYMNAGYDQEQRPVFAFYPHQDRFAAEPDELWYLPAGMHPERGIFLPQMETALSIVQDAAPLFGETVLVAGLGVVGLLVTRLLLLNEGLRVITLEPASLRRAAAEEAGAISIDPGSAGKTPPSLAEQILDSNKGREADTAINLSSTNSGAQICLDSLVYEGSLIEASWYGSKESRLKLGSSFHRKRLSIRSSQVSTIDPALRGRWDKKRRFELCMDLLDRIEPERYITHRFPLRDAAEAFDLIDRHPEDTIQVVLKP